MGIVRLINTLKTNLFIDSIAKNVVPGGQISLPDSIVDSNSEIAQCLASGILKKPDEEIPGFVPLSVEPPPRKKADPEPDQSKIETKPKVKAVAPPAPEEADDTAVVATGKKGETAKVKTLKSADMPMPEWLNKDQLRRSEAAAEAYDAREGVVEEWRITDEGIEKTKSGKVDIVSEDGVTVRAASNPAADMPEPVKIGRVKRTDDGKNEPLIDQDAADDYSGAFVDQSGKKPNPGYGTAFVD